MLSCLTLAVAIFSPLLLHAVMMGYIPIPVSLPEIDLSAAVSISAIIAAVIAFVFYRTAIKNAQEFLTKAEIWTQQLDEHARVTYRSSGFCTQNRPSWKYYANYKEYSSNDEGQATCGRLEISDCDFLTYHASPLIYTQLLPEKDDEFVVKVARTLEDTKTLLVCGFEYVTERDGFKIYKKRKCPLQKKFQLCGGSLKSAGGGIWTHERLRDKVLSLAPLTRLGDPRSDTHPKKI